MSVNRFVEAIEKSMRDMPSAEIRRFVLNMSSAKDDCMNDIGVGRYLDDCWCDQMSEVIETGATILVARQIAGC